MSKRVILVSASLFCIAFSPLVKAQYFQQGPKISPAGSGEGSTVGMSAYNAAVLSGSVTAGYLRGGSGPWLRFGLLPGSAAATMSGDSRTIATVQTPNGQTPQIVVYDSSLAKQQQFAGSGFSPATVPSGWSLALSYDGSTLVVGNPYDGGGVWGVNTGVGAVWVFVRSNGVWSQQGPKLVGAGFSGSAPGQGYSAALSGDGNTLLIGGPYDGDPSGANGWPGAVWAFTRSNGVWTQQGSKLTTASGGQFGSSVGLSSDGNTAMGGAPADLQGVGSATVFTRAGGVWSQGPTLSGTGAVGAAAQGFRGAISADGSTVVLCGPYDGAGAPGPYGSTWVFRQSNGVWSQAGPKVRASDAIGESTHQGLAVAVSTDGNAFIVGAPEDNQSAGAAWVFARPKFNVTAGAYAIAGVPTQITANAVDSTGYPVSG